MPKPATLFARLTTIMSGERYRARIVWGSIAIAVAGVPGFAQSNAVRWSTAPATVDAHAALDVVAVYRTGPAISADVDVPANLSFPPMYRDAIAAMVRHSAMFRRQCLRLAAAPHLTVTLRIFHHPYGPKARTTIRRTADNRLSAIVDIQPLGDHEELIAHEIEHIIEQLDEVDLAERAELRGSGVRLCADLTFETERAIHVGRLVARQARGGH